MSGDHWSRRRATRSRTSKDLGRLLRFLQGSAKEVARVGCSIAHAQELAYADGLDLEHVKVGIGLSCRLCNRADCRSRAFPPLEHPLALDPLTSSATPYRFQPREG